MYPDPIVDEVRAIGAQLAKDSGNDLHQLFEKLRETEKKYENVLVREPVPHYEAVSGVFPTD